MVGITQAVTGARLSSPAWGVCTFWDGAEYGACCGMPTRRVPYVTGVYCDGDW